MTPPPRKRTWRRKLRWVLVATAFSIVLWLVVSYAVAYRLTRRPEPLRPEPAPAIAWGTITPLRLATTDGQNLGAWFIPGRPDRPLVLLLHGNGECRSACLREAELASAAGSPVLMISFRAHGDSTGDVNDFGYSGRRDVAAAIAWLGERHPGRPIVVWGRSLGAAAALFAAPELGAHVGGYILECPYQDLRTAIRNRTRMYLPPVLDYVAYTGLSAVAPMVLPDVDEISPLKAAALVPPSARVLVLAGGADRRATPDEARALAEALGERAELVVIKRGGHLQLFEADPAAYRGAVNGFLDRFQQPARVPEGARKRKISLMR
jgi:alpha-beta hydrolase superfamily lysophospholipase